MSNPHRGIARPASPHPLAHAAGPPVIDRLAARRTARA